MKNLHCMNCGSYDLHRFIDLGDQPNGNHFPTEDTKNDELVFPFSMMVCRSCSQVQLEEFPSPEFMFSNHPYVTGINMPVVDHFDWLAKRTVKRFNIPANSLVIDIGCNDGTLLRKFQDNGMRVLGVDPGRLTGKLCREAGTTVCETFWNEATGNAIRQLNLKPKIISATAVFYHVQDIHNFVRGLSAVMDDETIFLAQCVNLKDVIEQCQFDHFYHEHTMIHSVGPLKRLFAEHGMRVIDVEHVDVHGGSFVIYVGRNANPHPTFRRVDEWIAEEEKAGLYTPSTYDVFEKRVSKNRVDLVNLLQQLKAEGKRVWALGAPLKGNTLLNYCKIGPDLCQKAVEVNRFKIGKLTPGMHIPVESENDQTETPDYYLVLTWNFLPFFVKKYEKFLNDGGRFIVPNPIVRVIGEGGKPV
ncbi:MAG: class I SAM-dependent methyltransferase [Planctomyces sp.]|jgi:SAM-dependent methyltransferase